MEGRMEGKRARGRPRKRMLDELLVELSYGNMKRKAETGMNGGIGPVDRQNIEKEKKNFLLP